MDKSSIRQLIIEEILVMATATRKQVLTENELLLLWIKPGCCEYSLQKRAREAKSLCDRMEEIWKHDPNMKE